MKRHRYVWRWICQMHQGWNEISFDLNAQTSTQWPSSPTISPTAYLSANIRVPCADVRVSQRAREKGGGRGKSCDDPPRHHHQKKTKYHSITAAIKACSSSITQMYQETKCLTDVRMWGERWGGKNMVDQKTLFVRTHTVVSTVWHDAPHRIVTYK